MLLLKAEIRKLSRSNAYANVCSTQNKVCVAYLATDSGGGWSRYDLRLGKQPDRQWEDADVVCSVVGPGLMSTTPGGK
jgi:hypothetical protein